MTDDIDYKTLLLQFIASLTLAEHMGDVSEVIDEVLKRVGRIDLLDYKDMSDLRTALGKEGVTTLYGTELTGE